jgi:hypothetical protein
VSLLLVQIGAEEDAGERDEARKRQRILKTALRVEFEKRQQWAPPVVQASTQQSLAKCLKRMTSGALHTARDAFGVAETEQLLNRLLDARSGDQGAIGRT